MGLILLAPLSIAYSLERSGEEEIETLDLIEITGSIVEKTPRDLSFPIPETPTYPHWSYVGHLSDPEWRFVKPIPTHSGILLDQTAKTINLHTPVKPLKTERPVYPRLAREQGWHGRAIVRLNITAKGTVESGTIHQSTGHQLLDDHAVNAATQWTFEPAKNGGFPVATTVNIPIQFDLVQ
jgi:protein TonB